MLDVIIILFINLILLFGFSIKKSNRKNPKLIKKVNKTLWTVYAIFASLTIGAIIIGYIMTKNQTAADKSPKVGITKKDTGAMIFMLLIEILCIIFIKDILWKTLSTTLISALRVIVSAMRRFK